MHYNKHCELIQNNPASYQKELTIDTAKSLGIEDPLLEIYSYNEYRYNANKGLKLGRKKTNHLKRRNIKN